MTKLELDGKTVEERIKKIDSTMAQENMSLTDEIKKKLYNCMTGKSTYEEERQKVIKKYRRIYGR